MGVKLPQIFLLGIALCPELQRKVMFANPPPPWELRNLQKHFTMDCMKCPDLHREVIYATPLLIAVHGKNIWNLTPPVTPMWVGIGNMTFCSNLDISFHSLQNSFLGNWPPTTTPHQELGDSIHDFSVQIWTFHAIPSKNLVLHPTPWGGSWTMTFCTDLGIQCSHQQKSANWPSPKRLGVPYIIFLCTSGYFMQFLAKKFFSNWNSIPTLPHRVQVETTLFCKFGHIMQLPANSFLGKCPLKGYGLHTWIVVQIGTFTVIPSKTFFLKVTPPSHSIGVGLHTSLLCKCGHFMKFLSKKVLILYPQSWGSRLETWTFVQLLHIWCNS